MPCSKHSKKVNTHNDTNYCPTRKLYQISENLKPVGFLFKTNFVRKKRSDLPVDEEKEEKEGHCLVHSAADGGLSEAGTI